MIGIVKLGIGAELMVRSVETIARTMGISELIIGMSIVALGTSLPEFAASVVSACKGEMDVSVGNVIGSNIFNILFVLGACFWERICSLWSFFILKGNAGTEQL